MTRKRLIINADDFGWDEAATNGILHLCENNCLTSTSILATHTSEKEIRELIKFPKISKGLHLNLIDGTPLSKNLSTLVDSNGMFFKANDLLLRFITGRIHISEIEQEIIAQISHLRDLGVDISHVDSHRHVHLFPVLGNVILSVLQKNGIKKIRSINQNKINDKRRVIIKLFSLFPNSEKKKFTYPELLLCDFSVAPSIDDDIFLKATLEAFKNNSTIELMTHPGTQDRVGSYQRRKLEYEYLLKGNWGEIIREQNIQLISYQDL